ncbi:DUF2505 domain-containing protein [Corynebacterium sp. 320]|uniref:DUF2505 domain-containing protein n=1 Tax=Corynebacterium zhongnanshanii TaxID=2768834 RepID=A0ABQ6VE50_9CORY|nr:MULTISPECIES: DUF2505 domain-containing protein [Corynebacterium]KAB1504440.1 DUF2505 domain-containing protein [Corynebacterium sp. 320]KAB1552461.1 DUF2505 domain-containing protein [Corynebacterium sp. 321]KAB1554324.1 DUF2505 domain-containing protein [Corynebacterium sp. 319]KAB3522704.1 DUF2505 domain-containing protein [Corynebacterium zhongnanshanii]KAB3528576.1 DUF2505 domain-containing protein [Corynebacterium sp. 250]
MTTHSENTATINFPIEKVHEALTSNAYWTYEVENIGDEPGQVHTFTEDPTKVELYELLPKAALPEAVRGFVSQDLKLKRVASFGPLADNTITGEVTAEVKGAPVSFSSEVKLTGEGDTTTLVADSAVDVKIPMMGPVLEPKVAEWLEDFLASEAACIEKWLADNQ